MSTNKIIPVPDSFWLEAYIGDFLDSLTKKGYAKDTMFAYEQTAARLCRQAEALALDPDNLDAELLEKLATSDSTISASYMDKVSLTARRITDDLIDKGVISKPPEDLSVGRPRDHLILEFDNWLKSNRGLYGGGIGRHHKVARIFLDYFGKTAGDIGDLSSLTPGVIHDFLDDHAGRNGWRIRYVRNILRFLFWSGRTSRDLSLAIPPVAGSRPKKHNPSC